MDLWSWSCSAILWYSWNEQNGSAYKHSDFAHFNSQSLYKNKKVLVLLFLYTMLIMTISLAGLVTNILIAFIICLLSIQNREKHYNRRSALRSLQSVAIMILLICLLYVIIDEIPL